MNKRALSRTGKTAAPPCGRPSACTAERLRMASGRSKGRTAALLTIALFAKSYKEAQSYVSPLMIVVIVPAVVGMLPGVELDARMAMIPIVGTSLASKELLAGSFDWPSLIMIFGASCLYALLALLVAVKLFQREEVLFRT